MLSAEDNRFLTQSDAGTGMGELIRRFWVPAILSEEVPKPDGEPKKITLLGEELLAFRDTEGPCRRHRSILPAPRHEPLAWAQRGMRHPVCLSRLEIRY